MSLPNTPYVESNWLNLRICLYIFFCLFHLKFLAVTRSLADTGERVYDSTRDGTEVRDASLDVLLHLFHTRLYYEISTSHEHRAR